MSELERRSAALCVEDLEKVYADGTRGLCGLSLEIAQGCFFGLLGPNGSGKSTLIGMVSGLVRAPAGRIFVFGNDVVAQASQGRLLVGVAPQDVHLDRFLTNREVLTYHGRYFGMAPPEAGRRADELLEVFDLSAKGATKPNRLSGGMRRAAADRSGADAPATAADSRRADSRRRRRVAPGAVVIPAPAA